MLSSIMQYEVYVTDYLEPMDPHDLTLLTEKLTAIHGCLNQRPQHEKQKLLKDMFKRSLINIIRYLNNEKNELRTVLLSTQALDSCACNVTAK